MPLNHLIGLVTTGTNHVIRGLKLAVPSPLISAEGREVGG